MRSLLEDKNIIKVGVAPETDALQVRKDHRFQVLNTLDLRYLATMTGHKPESLAKMAASLLDISLNKDLSLSCSDWEAKTLSKEQIEYAAKDVFVAIELFKKFANEIKPL